jgi:acetyltransferase-like isoleucine patch superfamily enzyme
VSAGDLHAALTDDQEREGILLGVNVGRHTYGHDASTFCVFMRGATIDVGAFCSIAPHVRILAGSEHVMTRATTFPMNALLFDPSAGNALDAIDRGTTRIGNDVWIGVGAIVLSGICVGDGAVIGAGAVVSKHVPPYAVVVGNPARILRYRFDEETSQRLLRLQWWEWSDEEMLTLRGAFTAGIEVFLEQAERLHSPRAESDLTRRLRELPAEHLTPRAQSP